MSDEFCPCCERDLESDDTAVYCPNGCYIKGKRMKDYITHIAAAVQGEVKVNEILPDGSGAAVISISRRPLLQRIIHKLFDCPTFWQWRRAFACPQCGSRYRCYWDGHDSDCGAGINLCGKCAREHEGHTSRQCRK